MSPTIYRQGEFRFFFFSREEPRKHVHVHCTDGEAKYWLEPEISLARNFGLSPQQLAKIDAIVREHENEFVSAWDQHFGS
ncbi:MAG: DUF4160 domain-containing protein [Pseudomonadales bacterium]